MKVIHYFRGEQSLYSSASYRHCFYIPAKNVILYKDRTHIHGFQGDTYWSLMDTVEALDEAKTIAGGEIPKVLRVYFEDVKEFEEDEPKLLALIQNARTSREIAETVKTGIEELLIKVRVQS